MKHPFLKSVLVLGTAFALMNCSSDDSTTQAENPPIAEQPAGDTFWILNAGDNYYISPNGVVVNAAGQNVGKFDNGSIVLNDGSILATDIDVGALPLGTLPNTEIPAPNSSASVLPAPTSSAVVTPTPTSSATVTPTPTSSETVTPQPNPTQSSSSVNQPVPVSSSEQLPATPAGQCFDKASNKNVNPYDNLQGPNGESYAYKEDCSVNCYYDPANSNCANIGNGSVKPQQSSSSQQPQQQPSSSSVKSSSSTVKPSSSSQGGQQGATPTFTPVAGGKNNADGWGSRYWDGCKPSCGWQANSPSRTARSCGKDGLTRLSGYDDANIKDGGNAGVCLDQSPRVINNIAYAYAASHSNGDCGKCFLLEFTGTSHDKPDPTALKGKKMVVMISNIGGDVGGTQFDIMIPGGGIGLYDCIDGSNAMSAVKSTERYGGILTTCGGAKAGANAASVKTCVEGYCNKISNADAKAGCLFMAEWYELANNPKFKATEVQCPKELTDRY